jgi:hypothetical protein
MNWRQGFLRTWVVLSMVWVVGAGALAINDWVKYSDSARATWAICRMTPDELKAAGWDGETWCSNRWEFAPPNHFAQFGGIATPDIPTQAAFGIVPPIVLLVGGLAIGWMLAGFIDSVPARVKI